MQTRIRKSTTRRAFSLLEVLLVVVILGILAAFVVPALLRTGDTARIDSTKALIGKNGPVALALSLYRTHLGKYPEELKELTEKPSDEEAANKWHGPYIEDPNSLKDSWQQELKYKKDGEHNGQDSYDLWSTGQNGQDGDDDDIGNWTKG
jgi:general secretion pathway protein G